MNQNENFINLERGVDFSSDLNHRVFSPRYSLPDIARNYLIYQQAILMRMELQRRNQMMIRDRLPRLCYIRMNYSSQKQNSSLWESSRYPSHCTETFFLVIYSAGWIPAIFLNFINFHQRHCLLSDF